MLTIAPRRRCRIPRQHGLGHARETEEIRLEHGVDFLVFAFFHAGKIAVAGIVHEHVYAAEMACSAFFTASATSEALVTSSFSASACLLRPADKVLNLLRVTRGDDHAVATIEQHFRKFASKSSGTTGDEPDCGILRRHCFVPLFLSITKHSKRKFSSGLRGGLKHPSWAVIPALRLETVLGARIGSRHAALAFAIAKSEKTSAALYGEGTGPKA